MQLHVVGAAPTLAIFRPRGTPGVRVTPSLGVTLLSQSADDAEDPPEEEDESRRSHGHEMDPMEDPPRSQQCEATRITTINADESFW